MLRSRCDTSTSSRRTLSSARTSTDMRFFWYLAAAALCLVTLPAVSSAPRPEKFLKKLEHIGQRVRDALISAIPAIEVLKKTKDLRRDDWQKALDLAKKDLQKDIDIRLK